MKSLLRCGVRLVLLLSVCLPVSATAVELRIGGTGAAIGVFEQLAEAYRRDNPGVDITVLPSLGSGGGIKAVLKGRISLGISARPLKAKERHKGAVASAFARTAFVFTTAETTAHGDRDFNATDIVDLYAGRLDSWPSGQPMRPILRPLNDSDSALLMREIAGLEQVLVDAHDRRGAVVSFTDQDAMNDTQKLVGSVGTATLCAILGERRPLQVLTFNGVRASNETVASGEYPLTKTLYFVTRGEPDGDTRRFLKFLRSPPVADTLTTLGLLPES